MHALTLPLLIEVIARAVEFPINLPMWFLTLNVIMGVIGIFAISKNQVDTTTSV